MFMGIRMTLAFQRSVSSFIKTNAPMWFRGSAAQCMGFIRSILPLHAAAWKASSGPIGQLLSAPNGTEQDELTRVWRENTNSQLNVVCITSALMAGVVTSAFSWPILSISGSLNLKSVFAIWYCSLILAISAIACASQQAIALSRMCTYADGSEKVRLMLGKTEDGTWVPRKLQLFIWQTPAMLQNGSIYSFILGLAILVWKVTAQSWSTDNCIVATVFSVALVISVTSYVITSIGIYGST